MTLVKDKMVMDIPDSSTAKMYIAHGWQVLKEKVNEPEPEVMVDDTITKKELQKQLDELGIEYKPQENKASLIAKLKTVEPANDFDDGLLKG